MRWLLLLVVVALLALVGCGEDTADDEAGEVRSASGDAAAEVTVAFDEPLRAGEVTWRVELTAGQAVELSFTTGQRADVALTDAAGEEVYRWSRSQLFTQQLGELALGADQSRTFELGDVLEVDPGEYELEASITATGRDDLVTSRTVTVQPR